MSWSDADIKILKDMWAKGESAGAIAARLGNVTRNAVIGKVHRLKLDRRRPGNTKPKSQKIKKQTEVSARARPTTVRHSLQRTLAPLRSSMILEDPVREIVLPEPSPTGKIGVMELRDGMCKWPIGDPGATGFHFCGTRQDFGSVYCPYHRALAYVPDPLRNSGRKAA